MLGKGNCYDYADVETFFKFLKVELVWGTTFETRNQAEKVLFKHINRFHKPKRHHSHMGNISPMCYEIKAG